MLVQPSQAPTHAGGALCAAAAELARVAGGTPDERWRWRVRQALTEVRDALGASADAGTADGVAAEEWLSARVGGVGREADRLLARTGALAAVLLTEPVESLAPRARRLAEALLRHDQRRHDLAYDDVELELGGSE